MKLIVRLIEPSEEFESEFRAMVTEISRAGESFGFERALSNFTEHLYMLRAESAGVGLRSGEVPMTTLWLIDKGGRLLGESRLRHRLTPALEEYGGHIGYVVRPSDRRKGFGTKILSLTLAKALAIGLHHVRLTCDTDNVGSSRIIERNGGILSGYGVSPVNGKLVSQYWIDL